MMAAIQEGDDVIVIAPGYQSLSEVARSAGANVYPWEPRTSTSTSSSSDTSDVEITFDVNDLKQIVDEQCVSLKMIVVNFPHNPTGVYLCMYVFVVFQYLQYLIQALLLLHGIKV